MFRLFDWIATLIGYKPPPCRHLSMNYREWREPDGALMVRWSCPDCGWRDCGPVIER